MTTVKELRAEARKRLLKCGNGKTISRMNKRELLSFMDCIQHPDFTDDVGLSLQDMYREPKRRAKWKPGTKRKEPKDYYPVTLQDELEPGELNGSGMPDTYRAFVKAMLPRAQQKHSGPNAMRAVAKMWQQHKQQRGHGLNPAGAVSGRGLTLTGSGAASNISSGAKGTAAALGLAGLAQPEFAPILEPAGLLSLT
jgi:hypothetical protein